MNKLVFLLLLLTSFAYAQTVDEIRLGYDVQSVKAKLLSATATEDGKLMALAFNNGTVKIFDVVSQKYKATIQTSDIKEIHDLRITSDEKVLITAFDKIKIYQWKTGQLLKELELPARSARFDYNAKNNIYVVGQMGGNFSSFDLTTMTQLFTKKFGGMMINALALDPESKYAAASFYAMGGKYHVRIFDIRSGEELKTLDKAMWHTLSYDTKGNLLAYGWGNAGTFFFKVFDSQYNPTREFETKMQTYGYVEAGFSGTKAVFTTASLTLDVYDIEAQKLTYTSLADKGLSKIVGNYAYPKITRLSDTKFMFSYGNYNMLRIYDTTINDVSMYLFVTGGDEFAVVSKDGRIDGDINTLNKVYWTARKSKTRTSLEQTFERGFTPRLFNILMASENQAQTSFDADAVAEAMPTIAIRGVNGAAFSASKPVVSTQKNGKIDFTLGGKITDVAEVRLYQNGKLVKTVPANGTTDYSFDIMLNNAFGEDNFFAAVAVNKNGIESEKVKAVIQYKGATTDKPKMFLVTIGINEYKNPKYSLNYALADADGIDKSVRSIASGIFSEVVQYTIRNDKAVKEKIIQTFDEIKSKALEQDMLVVYYAGHGVVSTDEKGSSDFYLALHDLTQLYGKAELLSQKALSATEIKKLTAGINAQKQVFLLDACQSGAALESASKRGVEEEKAIAQLARSTGTFWITASGSEQFATEVEKLGHGIFTYTILEGIKGKADANQDGKLSVRELSVYIEEEVPVLTEKYKGTAQYPSSYSFGNDFPIGVVVK